jgi:hypothetical protein
MYDIQFVKFEIEVFNVSINSNCKLSAAMLDGC